MALSWYELDGTSHYQEGPCDCPPQRVGRRTKPESTESAVLAAALPGTDHRDARLRPHWEAAHRPWISPAGAAAVSTSGRSGGSRRVAGAHGGGDHRSTQTAPGRCVRGLPSGR